ncbi:27683_t:CDS:2, partial [Dentiscutata erythropus]
CNGTSIGQIIKEENYSPYFKSTEMIILLAIKTTLTTMIYSNMEFANINLMESNNGSLQLIFSDQQNIQKELCFEKVPHGSRNPIRCSIFINKFEVKDTILESNHINNKISTMTDILSIVQFCKKSSICIGQYTRNDHIYSSYLGPQNNHEIIATLENKGFETKAYRRVDCIFFVLNRNICINYKTLRNTLYKIEKRHANSAQPVRTPYASREILTKLVMKKLVKELSERLKLKFEAEEEPISEPLTNIVYNVIEEVKTKKYEDVPNIILKELIRMQSEKPNGIRYHPMFIRWAISIYSRGPAVYKAMKSIIRMPSLSTLKSNINETSQYTEIEVFGKQYLDNVQNYSNDQKDDEKDCKRTLATQVHQIVWYSITHSFNFPIAYFAIETISVHTLNTILFSLAAKLECVAIYTYRSVCNGAGENRRHIKSFDWFATTWKIGDKVEVQLLNKLDKKSYKPSTIIAFNPEHTEFSVKVSGNEQSHYNVTRSALQPPMLAKTTWNMNDQCEVRSIVDNEWYPGKISTRILVNGYLEVAIKTTKIQPIIWKSVLSDICPLKNNISKSHTGNSEKKSVREIMYNDYKISWRHFQGVYDHTIKHTTAKATKLTKRHIWLTPWSKMRVDLVEYTLSLNDKNAMVEIPELMNISQGTQLFINYARMYRDITHSRICISSLENPCLNTLKEIKYWFIQGDKEKKNPSQWCSSQCQFDLILSINGFLGIIEYVLSEWPNAMIQPRRISQDMLEGLFGTIREMNGDSSTQTDHKEYTYYKTRIETLSTINSQIFKELFDDDLIMRHIFLSLSSTNENIKVENTTINNLQLQRTQLIEYMLYYDDIDSLLVSWSKKICQLVLDSVPEKKSAQWMAIWSINLENHLNNYKCADN